MVVCEERVADGHRRRRTGRAAGLEDQPVGGSMHASNPGSVHAPIPGGVHAPLRTTGHDFVTAAPLLASSLVAEVGRRSALRERSAK